MSGKKPPPVRMAAAARDIGITAGTTEAVGEVIPIDEQLKKAVEQFFRRTVRLDENRKKRQPKWSVAESDKVLAQGKSVEDEA
ncbi:MAG: hypothetical protein M3N13_06535, partial [Candidatus Eremiobacteraeota bacterium]|nr:hypothetical protein [Candidatus Eremiobacteraeota bacterium]